NCTKPGPAPATAIANSWIAPRVTELTFDRSNSVTQTAARPRQKSVMCYAVASEILANKGLQRRQLGRRGKDDCGWRALVAPAAAVGGFSMARLTGRESGARDVAVDPGDGAGGAQPAQRERARQQRPPTGGAKPRAARRRLGSGGLRESLAPILPERGP